MLNAIKNVIKTIADYVGKFLVVAALLAVMFFVASVYTSCSAMNDDINETNITVNEESKINSDSTFTAYKLIDDKFVEVDAIPYWLVQDIDYAKQALQNDWVAIYISDEGMNAEIAFVSQEYVDQWNS